MKLKLLRQVKGSGKAGEIVEVSPDRAQFLLEFKLAEPVVEIREQIKAPEKKPAAKKTTTRSKK